jgi:hypothetical protein
MLGIRQFVSVWTRRCFLYQKENPPHGKCGGFSIHAAAEDYSAAAAAASAIF